MNVLIAQLLMAVLGVRLIITRILMEILIIELHTFVVCIKHFHWQIVIFGIYFIGNIKIDNVFSYGCQIKKH